MNDTTNVLTLPARRRDDTAPAAPAAPARRSREIYFGNKSDDAFAEALLAKARADNIARANLHIARNVEKRINDDKLRQRQLREARQEGFDKGEEHGYRSGWYWGLFLGLAIGGSVVGLCVKAGVYAALHT